MPRTRSRKAPVEDERIAVAVTIAWVGLEDGTTALIRDRDRFRGDHPLVSRFPHLFIPDGEGSDARLRALVAMEGTPRAPEPEPAPARRMRCVATINAVSSVESTEPKLAGGFSPDLVPAMVQINEGDVLSENDPIVAKYPDCFEAVDDD